MESGVAPVYVLIPAYEEGARIADTVAAARALPGVSQVLVIDDGSSDDTGARAEGAGATVIRLPENAGKGAALRAGLHACPAARDDIILLLDADLGASAAEAAQLLHPVQAGEADLTIATFPRLTTPTGFGLVKGFARVGTWLISGLWLAAPLSGQRACRRWVLDAAPFAERYGVEVALNIAAGDAGARVRAVPVAMTHAVTGRTLAGFTHRGRQGWDILRALTAAAFGRTGERLLAWPRPGRALCWLLALYVGFQALFTLPQARWWVPGWMHLPVLLLALFIGPPLAVLFSVLLHARRPNYRARRVPALGGLFLVPLLATMIYAEWQGPSAAWIGLPADNALPTGLQPLLLCWVLLGLFDDLWGNADRRGFRGHVRALLQGKFTTGGVKLFVGGVLAFAMASSVNSNGRTLSSLIEVLVATLLIALSANALNLFDLRPGRALKACWLGMAILLGLFFLTPALAELRVAGPYLMQFSLLLLLATLVYAPLDFAGMMMLGDTGSNMLGAFLGLALVLIAPLPVQGVLVAALIGLHLYTERHSLTRLIEEVPWLRWVDGLGRSE
ncbi:MAG: glycosyltransferase family 2 protein [Armatimonadota bacterium]